ncbi:MAG: glycosyltransferase [Candidatus Bathyarchaeota archaeon]|nr:glycosyltransferase [Candidatus Bathyarchaeota archaeon]
MIACNLLKVSYAVDYRDEWEDYIISLSSNSVISSVFYKIKKIATYLYDKSKLIVTVTTNTAFVLRRRCRGKVELVTNGADTETFKPSLSEKDATFFKLFYSGDIGGYYRLDVVLRSIKHLVDEGDINIKLIIAGSGEVKEILDLAALLGISNNIEYIGEICDKKRLSEIMSNCHVGIIPYDDNPLWRNSLPAKFYEYCSCGLPVITTSYDNSILTKLIRENEIGLCTNPLDEIGLAMVIAKIYNDKEFRINAGKKARILIEKHFDRNQLSKDFLSAICKDINELN